MDELFLLKQGFENPAYPDKKFFCWHCALIEGVLNSFPEQASKIRIHHVEWARPRTEVIKVAGSENQSLPILVLQSGKTSEYQTGSFNGRSLIEDKDAILKYLTKVYCFPEPHP